MQDGLYPNTSDEMAGTLDFLCEELPPQFKSHTFQCVESAGSDPLLILPEVITGKEFGEACHLWFLDSLPRAFFQLTTD